MFDLLRRKIALGMILLAVVVGGDVWGDCLLPAEYLCCVKDEGRTITDSDATISHRRPNCSEHISGVAGTPANYRTGDLVHNVLTQTGAICVKRLVKGKKQLRSTINYPKTRRWCRSLGGKIAKQRNCYNHIGGLTLTPDNRVVCDWYLVGTEKKYG